MTIVSNAQAAGESKQTIMRFTLGMRFHYKDKLFDEMASKASALQWLEMATNPTAFAGTRLSNHTEEIFRSIIFKHVARAWVIDPAQSGLGLAMAHAMQKRPDQQFDISGLAFENFARVINAATLPQIADGATKANSQAMAIEVMHRMVNANPEEKALGKIMRGKLDEQLAAYAAPLLLPIEPAKPVKRPPIQHYHK